MNVEYEILLALIGVAVGVSPNFGEWETGAGPAPAGSALLLESGDHVLLESGDQILLE